MKSVTFTADEELLEQAQQIAHSQQKTLAIVFREWLEQYAAQARTGDQYADLMERLQHVDAGRSFSREQRNER